MRRPNPKKSQATSAPHYDAEGKLTEAGLDHLGRLVLETCPDGLPFPESPNDL